MIQFNMRLSVHYVMDRKIKERLELALRPAEPPTLEEVLEHVSRRGVLRGPVDWVFPAWMLYVEYATQRIIETFQLSEEEKEATLPLQRYAEAASAGGVDAGKGKADDAVQSRRRGHVQGGGRQIVRTGRDVDVYKRELCSTYSNPHRNS
jgi:hypothetical protein